MPLKCGKKLLEQVKIIIFYYKIDIRRNTKKVPENSA